MEKEKLQRKRLAKVKRLGCFLQTIPYVRAVLLNGSLAMGNTKESSDIDLLLIVKSGRLYTCRFVVLFVSTICQIKRPKDTAKSHAGKFCFNYFLADNYLKIPTGRGEKIDQYCADSYGNSVLIYGDQIYDKFSKVNRPLFSRSKKHPSEKYEKVLKNYFPLKKSHFSFLQTLAESILNGRIGGWFEQYIKNFQIRKIKSDPITARYPDLIVYNDLEARFHPPKH